MDERQTQQLNTLLAALARGQIKALDDIYAMMGSRMFAVAAGIVRDRATAEDVVSESFIKLARFARRYKNTGNPSGWILRIVRNTALDCARRRKLRPVADADAFYTLTDGAPPDAADDRLALAEALAKLAPTERQAIYDRYYLDMTVAETARELKLSRSAADRLLKRAEENLKKFLNPAGKDGGKKR